MDFVCCIRENFTTILVFCVTLALVYLTTRKRKSVPPGPQCWPIIGSSISLAGGNLLENLEKLRNKYGDVCSIYTGSDLNIILSGYDVIHDALVKHGSTFSFRPTSMVDMQRDTAVVCGNGEVWKDLRRFTLSTLKELCFQKTRKPFEERIYEEASELIKVLLTSKGDCNIFLPISLSFANVIYCIIHGHRIGYEDKRFLWYEDVLENSFKRHMKVRLLKQCFPWLKHFPGDLLKEKFLTKLRSDLKEYFTEVTRPNVDNHQLGDENCLIDFWLNEREIRDKFYDDVTLRALYNDLMAAGTETSATTLKWIILALLKNPRIQTKLQQQVDSVLGKDQTPSISDKEKLPYVEATILEGLRFGCPVPLAIPHTVTHDTVLNGYVIPKESTVLPNLTSVHYDPTIFPEPREFKPERFLNNDETKIERTEKLVPFSLGPRSCLGETIARMELLIFLVTLVQKIEFCPPEAEVLPSMNGDADLTYRPKQYKVKIVKR